MKPKVLIIGAGFVGGTLYKVLSKLEGYEVLIHDKFRETCKLAKEVENINWCNPNITDDFNADIFFICLPTPMVIDVGCADTSLITDWVSRIDRSNKHLAEVVIKSTVPPGFTAGASGKFGGGVFFNPEFLTEKNALEDFINLPYQIIGTTGNSKPIKTTKLFKDCYAQGLLKCRDIYETSATTAEMVKYTRNCYLATRISFFNEINQFCERTKVPFDEMKQLAGLDERVGNHYNRIDPEEPEFSGHCLPKDINALISKYKDFDLKPTVLTAVWEKNLEVAKKREWEKMDGRAVSGKQTKKYKMIKKMMADDKQRKLNKR